MMGKLRKRSQFLKVAAARRSWAAPGLVVQARRTDPGELDGNGDFRIGFTATRRLGGAVQRNRAKRRLREVARKVMPDCAAPCHDYVIIGRAATERRAFDHLERDLKTALARLRVTRMSCP